MSGIYVGCILLWTVKFDKMLVEDPALEVVAQYFVPLLRVPGGPMC